MDEKKKISIDEIFEEEIVISKPEKKEEKKTPKREEIDEIFEEFLPAPAEEPIKKKKKVSEELLEEYLTPPPKIVEKEKVEKPKEKKIDEGLADFLIHPPAEEEKKVPPPSPKKPTPVTRESPKAEVKKPVPPKPVEPPPQPLKEREIVVEKRSSIFPFLTGFFAGGFFTLILVGVLWLAGPLKNFTQTTVQAPSVKVTLPPPPPQEKKVVEEPVKPPPPEEKPKEVTTPPPSTEKPVEATSPPPSPRFRLTISNIKSESDLNTVKNVLLRNGVGLQSEDRKEVSKEVYEVYLDATYSPAEEEAVKLKLELLGIKCAKKGNQLSCGVYDSPIKANEIKVMLLNAGLPAKLRVVPLKDVSWTIVTLPVEGEKEAVLRRELKKFRITSQKIE